jgi:hypothetical protein
MTKTNDILTKQTLEGVAAQIAQDLSVRRERTMGMFSAVREFQRRMKQVKQQHGVR